MQYASNKSIKRRDWVSNQVYKNTLQVGPGLTMQPFENAGLKTDVQQWRSREERHSVENRVV